MGLILHTLQSDAGDFDIDYKGSDGKSLFWFAVASSEERYALLHRDDVWLFPIEHFLFWQAPQRLKRAFLSVRQVLEDSPGELCGELECLRLDIVDLLIVIDKAMDSGATEVNLLQANGEEKRETIARAKSGKSRCFLCKQAIETGRYRFGLPGTIFPNPTWYHLDCAAPLGKRFLRAAARIPKGEIPGIEILVEYAGKVFMEKEFPFFEYAPSARSSCIVCRKRIPKDGIRLSTLETFPPGEDRRVFTHPACAFPVMEGFLAKAMDILFKEIRGGSPTIRSDHWPAIESEFFNVRGDSPFFQILP